MISVIELTFELAVPVGAAASAGLSRGLIDDNCDSGAAQAHRASKTREPAADDVNFLQESDQPVTQNEPQLDCARDSDSFAVGWPASLIEPFQQPAVNLEHQARRPQG